MLASSAASSSRVATLNSALAEPAAKVADTGAAPSSTASLSVTASVTVSAAAVLPVRVSVNEAGAPSLTGVDAGAIDTTGSVCGPGTVRASPPTNFRPFASHAACCAAQSAVARAASVTASPPSGSTVTSQRRFLPFSSRRALTIRPPATSNSPPCTVR